MKWSLTYSIITLSILTFIFFTGCWGKKIIPEEPPAPSISQKEIPVKKPEPSFTPAPRGMVPMVVGEKTWFVLPERLNLRACAGLNCQVLGVLSHGEELFQTGEREEWMRVRVKATHKEGWVFSKYLGKEPSGNRTIFPHPREIPKLQEEWAPSGKETKNFPHSPKENLTQ
jgi:uncharacterized protein YgiM (DUF1202 family)